MPEQPGVTAQQKDPRQLGSDLVQALAQLLAHNSRFLDDLHNARPLFFRGTVTALQSSGGVRHVQVKRAGQSSAEAYWYPVYDAGYNPAVGDDVLLAYTDRRLSACVIGALAGGLGGGAANTVTIVSALPARALLLWNGTSNNAAPSSWYTSAYDDSAWAQAVAFTGGYSTFPGPLAGTTPLSVTAGNTADGAEALFRQAFTLPAGTPSAATFTFRADDLQVASYLNGHSLGSQLSPSVGPSSYGPDLVVSVDPTWLVPGGQGTNVLATDIQNQAPSGYGAGGPNPAWASYTLVVTYPRTGAGGGQEGDLLYFHAGQWADLGIGPSGDVLTSDGTDPGWAAPTGGGSSVTVFAHSHFL